jgi:phenylacetic acid degradation operon negative regulatory protein
MQDGNTPFTARSVLASSLLGMDPPELPVAQLVYLSGLFGINENRARVALSRMVAAGEVTTNGSGRYRLAGHLLERQSRQTTSRMGRSRPYSGSWHFVVVTKSGSTAEVRGERRAALQFARLAELREGSWLRPDNLALKLSPSLLGDVELFTAQPSDPMSLVTRLWDLHRWSLRAQDLLSQLRVLLPISVDDLAPGFVLSAAVLRHLQADPLLPPELLPPQWPGVELRTSYESWDQSYRALLYRSSAGRGRPQ